MNKQLLIGAGLAVVGILLVVFGNVEFSRREEVLRFGDFSASATTKRTVPGLRYAGVALIGAGVAVLVVDVLAKRK